MCMCVEETALRLFGIAVAQLPDSDRAAAETSVDKIVPTLERRGELNVPLLKCTFESSIARDEFVVELESLGATRAFTDSLARCAIEWPRLPSSDASNRQKYASPSSGAASSAAT